MSCLFEESRTSAFESCGQENWAVLEVWLLSMSGSGLCEHVRVLQA